MNIAVIISISIISAVLFLGLGIGLIYYLSHSQKATKPAIVVLRNDVLSVSSIGTLYNNFDPEVTAQILMNTEVPKSAIIISQMELNLALAAFEHLSESYARKLILVLDEDLCEQIYKTAGGRKLRKLSGKRFSQISNTRPLSYEFRKAPESA